MVEIKRTRPGTSFLNKPVGVVNIKTGEEGVLQEKAKMFSTVSDIGFKIADQMQRQEATQAANNVQIRDAEGNLTYENVENLGNFGRSQADIDRIVAKRFLTAHQVQVKTEMTLLANEALANNTKSEIFKVQMNDYMNSQLEALRKVDTPENVLSLVQDQMHGYAGGFITARQAENLKAEKNLAARNFKIAGQNGLGDLLSLPPELAERAYRVLTQNFAEEAPEHGLSDSEVLAFQNNAQDNLTMNYFNQAVRNNNITTHDLRLLQAKQYDHPRLKPFSKLINILKNTDQTRLDEFETQLSQFRENFKALQKETAGMESVLAEISTGINPSPTGTQSSNYEKFLNSEFGRLPTPRGALYQNDESLGTEANFLGVSESTMEALEDFADGILLPEDAFQAMRIMSAFEEASLKRGYTLQSKLGQSSKGSKIIARYQQLKGLAQRGPTDFQNAYMLTQGGALPIDQQAKNMAENLFGSLSDATEFGYAQDKTPEKNIQDMITNYVNKIARDAPAGVQQSIRGLVKYAATIPNQKMDALVEDHLTRYFPPSMFMEQSRDGDYSKYGMPPEYYVGYNPEALEDLQTAIEKQISQFDLGFEDVALRLITGSDAGASYVIYQKGGTDQALTDANGIPLTIDTRQHLKAVDVRTRFSEREIMSIREVATQEIFHPLLIHHAKTDFSSRTTNELYTIRRKIRGVGYMKSDQESALKQERLLAIDKEIASRRSGGFIRGLPVDIVSGKREFEIKEPAGIEGARGSEAFKRGTAVNPKRKSDK